jgi:CheY-like chemotaxis protein
VAPVGQPGPSAKVAHRLTVFHDSRRALEYLARPDAPDALQPDLILLDLNLPGLDGCQVLSRIKGHPTLRAIPVVILSTSRREEDVTQTYQAGANSFIPKPDEYPRYVRCADRSPGSARGSVRTADPTRRKRSRRSRVTRPAARRGRRRGTRFGRLARAQFARSS